MRVLRVAIVAVVVVAVIAGAVIISRRTSSANTNGLLRVSGIPSSVSTPVAALMALSPVPTTSAPNFTLTDQKGRTLSLSSLRGKSVVLEFMDPHCVDICPLVSQEFVNAYHDLGAASSNVVFIAVNVNQYFSKVSNVAAFSSQHQLDTIPSWHFFTGPTNALQAVWHDYGVAVAAPNPNADIVHTSIIYFIDPNGNERFVATPSADHTASGKTFLPRNQIVAWGHGIAAVAHYLAK